ncbi:hypothetical protein FD755_002276 [Muntiacus reevesi]|uniref:ATM interactor n=1 Tax=Muntiacus reevesi TaxID=9886 RepID=A0A5J5N9E5_MUNRE|nr:hypothetical protein FD755_002276 [Muntiacus reevesi]
MAASEAVEADPAALALGAPDVPAATRGAAATSGPWVSPAPELIQPLVSELSWAVRTNIPCMVRSCSEILPNSPVINMHRSSAHGIFQARVLEWVAIVPKFYCFSQFSLVKQHFMKMHAEKKHKCSKDSNSYGTEWALKRHAEDCGKTFQCTCGCPYASRTALQDPPSTERKIENCLHSQKLSSNHCWWLLLKTLAALMPNSRLFQQLQMLLLPKPRVALVKLPIMQFSPMTVFAPTADSSAQPVVLSVDQQGCALGAMKLLAFSIGTLILGLVSEPCSLKESLPLLKVVNAVAVELISTGIQVNLGKSPFSSISVQTDLSHTTPQFMPFAPWASPDSSVSPCSQTYLTFDFQVSLPISVQTQTFLPISKVTLSITAQTDAFIDASFQPGRISRETQTSEIQHPADDRVQMDQAVMCGDIFESVHSSYCMSTDNIISSGLVTEIVTHDLLPQNHPKILTQDIEKSAPIINCSTPNSMLSSQNTTYNQTPTMDLLSDLENILSRNLPGQMPDNRSLLSDTNAGPDTQLPSGPAQNPEIDFDVEEFFSASNIQTQTEESELSTMTTELVLESLDTETQTDFFLADPSTQAYSCRGNSSFLGLDIFDTQTDGPELLFRHLSLSTDSSDTDTQTDGISTAKHLPALEKKVRLDSAETQTMNSGFETLGSLFFTSNETQTAMDDFLLADLVWNTMESQFSSVETQMCAELHPVSNF